MSKNLEEEGVRTSHSRRFLALEGARSKEEKRRSPKALFPVFPAAAKGRQHIQTGESLLRGITLGFLATGTLLLINHERRRFQS